MPKGLDVFFYCSYKLSSRGYVFTKADIENGQTICLERENISLLPKAVKKAFSTGGAEMVVSKYNADGKYYIVVKGIENENKERGIDELGRLVYVNVAFVSDSKETICKLATYIVMNYTKWCVEISSVVLPSPDDDAGYKIDCRKTSELLEGINHDKLIYENKKLNKYVDKINNFKTDYSFVVLSAGKTYFLEMFNLDGAIVPESVCIDKEDFIKSTKETGIKKIDIPNSVELPKTIDDEKMSNGLKLEHQEEKNQNEKLKSEPEMMKKKSRVISPVHENDEGLILRLQEAENKANKYEKRANAAENNVNKLEEKIKELYMKMLISAGVVLVIFIIFLIKIFGI